MPSFERILRELELELAPTKQDREIAKARHKGKDIARYEMLAVVIALIALVSAFKMLA